MSRGPPPPPRERFLPPTMSSPRCTRTASARSCRIVNSASVARYMRRHGSRRRLTALRGRWHSGRGQLGDIRLESKAVTGRAGDNGSILGGREPTHAAYSQDGDRGFESRMRHQPRSILRAAFAGRSLRSGGRPVNRARPATNARASSAFYLTAAVARIGDNHVSGRLALRATAPERGSTGRSVTP